MSPKGMQKSAEAPIYQGEHNRANPNRVWTIPIALGLLLTSFFLPNSESVMVGLVLPGLLYALGGISFLAYFIFPARKYQLRLFRDRLEAITDGKPTKVLAYEAIKKVLPGKRNTTLLAENKKENFLLENGSGNKLLGLLELLIQHGEMLPDLVWSFFYLKKESLAHKMIRDNAQRLFLDQEGGPLFLDNGFVLDTGINQYYFPNSTTRPFLKKTGEARLSAGLAQPGQVQPLIRFEPDPERLPLRALLIAMLNAKQNDEVLKGQLEMLAAAHGGAILQAPEADNSFPAQTAGFDVRIILT